MLLYFLQLTLFVFWYIAMFITKFEYGGRACLNWLYKDLFFNKLIEMSLDSYLETLVTVYVSFRAWNYSTGGEIAGLAFSVVSAISSLLIVPIAVIFIIWCAKGKNAHKKTLVNTLTTNLITKTRRLRGYYLGFVLRRAVFLSIAFVIPLGGGQQLQSLFLVNLLYTFYSCRIRPQQRRHLNRLERFNELMISACTVATTLFTDYVYDYSTRYNLGWFYISLVGIFCIVNTAVILHAMIHQLILLCTKYGRIANHKWEKLMGTSVGDQRGH